MCVNPKYNINRLLRGMPGTFRDNEYALCIHLGISLPTLRNWMNTHASDNFDIRYGTMHKMAEFFGIKPDALINKPIQTV